MPKERNRSTFRRLFFDLETSPNTVFSWRIGRKIDLTPDNIIDERSIICACYKWEGEKKVHSIQWSKGDDKALVKELASVLNSADQVVGHNGDRYDIPWVKTRAIFHGVEVMPKYVSIDTLKLSRGGFSFNSNKLDYIARFLGLKGKISTGYDLWKKIVLFNDKKSMNKMVKYCKNDVVLLEQVFKKLQPYTASRVHVGVFLGKDKCSCPECASSNVQSRGYMVSASGGKKRRLQCTDCAKWFSVSMTKKDE